MKRFAWTRLAALALIPVPLLSATAGGQEDIGAGIAPHPDLQALVAAERAFARDAAATSIREAFLTWLDDGALVFDPLPTDARARYESRPVTPARLVWEPVYAAVARSGELGYTTGPWSFRASPQDSVAAWGDFVSVWRRHADGTWRVAIDLGVQHPQPTGKASRLGFPGDGRFSPATGQAAAAAAESVPFADELRAAESALAARSQDNGAPAAYAAQAAPELRLYREGGAPILNRERAVPALAARGESVTDSRVLGVGASRAGDLGYAWGEAALKVGGGEAAAAGWVRIWRRAPDGVWQIVLDITLAEN